jgi:excisionase family DNA binding protein
MMTVKQVAERLGVSRAQVYALCSCGKLPHHRFGNGKGAIRVSDDQLAAFIEGSLFRLPAAIGVELRHIQLPGEQRPEGVSASR